MSKQDDQDFCIMVVAICALVLALCCAIKKTVLDKQHRPAVKASEEVTTTEETE